MVAGPIDIGVTADEVAEASDFPVLPAGTYEVLVSNCSDLKHSGKPGKAHYLEWEFTVTRPVEHEGAKLFYNTPVTKEPRKGANFLQDLCDAVGGYAWSGTLFDPDAFLGESIQVEVGIRQYEGKDRNDVKSVSKLA